MNNRNNKISAIIYSDVKCVLSISWCVFITKMIEIPEYAGDPKILDPYKIRLGFIRKVYGILSVQLAFTAVLSAIAVFSEHYQRFILSKEGQALLILSSLLTIVILIMIACFERVKSKFNYLLFHSFHLFH